MTGAEGDTTLEAGKTCWRVAHARRAAVIVDAADYFRHARRAMAAAQAQILLIGWDFDTRIDLLPEGPEDGPGELGAFLQWLPKQRPGLQIHILKWDLGALKLFGRGSTVLRLARWAARHDIHFKLDGAHPPGASHHQKIVVIDDALAFCGGIDMTADRWDTRAHRDDDPGRRRPTTQRRYGPWHDATTAVDGEAARALGELARERWRAAGGEPIEPPPAAAGDRWPDGLAPMFEDVELAISRTRGAYDGQAAIREIEALFVEQIRTAERFIYAENQYFASRRIAQAVLERVSAPDCPEIVIVNPCTANGWLEEEAMGPARAHLLREIRRADRAGRFQIYYPVTAGGCEIYVHAKIFIADGRVLRVGSANMNNRSLGLDSECDLTLDATRPANAHAAPAIERLMHDLLAEHLASEPEVVAAQIARTGSLISAITALAHNPRRLVALPPTEPNAAETALVENQLFDPEGSDEDFERIARPGLLAGLRPRARYR
jgi:phospholipase D1/2